MLLLSESTHHCVSVRAQARREGGTAEAAGLIYSLAAATATPGHQPYKYKSELSE
jgi:hypothetical protein